MMIKVEILKSFLSARSSGMLDSEVIVEWLKSLSGCLAGRTGKQWQPMETARGMLF
jgi:hypothetical protein